MSALCRYARITSVMPREFVLLQGKGCVWRQCTFCDYHQDVSAQPYAVNAPVLAQVTGEFGVLDIINSGSALELDEQSLEHIARVVQQKHIHTLWFEAHYLYRHELAAFAQRFAPAKVNFRCGVESFNPQLRTAWRKGIAAQVQPQDIARYFQGVCLLACVQGQSKDDIVHDISTACALFDYASVNVFCKNSTSVQRDASLHSWFMHELYPSIRTQPKLEILCNNTDLGVG
jgi:uncharacterized Fe-S cluster-containing MiaB family protein